MATTIAVSNETKKMLNAIGQKGETYDEIIRHAVQIARKEIFLERQERILADSEGSAKLEDL